jgi:hypothetical protein
LISLCNCAEVVDMLLLYTAVYRSIRLKIVDF